MNAVSVTPINVDCSHGNIRLTVKSETNGKVVGRVIIKLGLWSCALREIAAAYRTVVFATATEGKSDDKNKYKGYYLLSVGFLGILINQTLKMICRVPRPWVKDPNFTIVESAREAATGYSFPSGHTQSSVGLLGTVARMTTVKALRIATIVLAVLVPISRLYLGVHTLADVLVSSVIAVALVLLFYPLFVKAEENPKIIYFVLGTLVALTVAYICYVSFWAFPKDVYLPENIHNLESARKNGATLIGASSALLVCFAIDRKFVNFDTRAVWWVQIIKTVLGIGVVVAIKELTKAPLDAMIGSPMISRAVRYFIVTSVGALGWPLTFKWFAKLDKKAKAD